MPGGRGNKMQNALLRRIMQNGNDKESAIRIAKSKGWIEQNGGHLALTQEGRSHAKEAMRHLEKGGYEYSKESEKWKGGSKKKVEKASNKSED